MKDNRPEFITPGNKVGFGVWTKPKTKRKRKRAKEYNLQLSERLLRQLRK